jgi:hypothetical protein
MVNGWLTLALSICDKTANGHKAKGAGQRAGTRRATVTGLRKLDVKARLDGSIEIMTDGESFAAYQDVASRAVILMPMP